MTTQKKATQQKTHPLVERFARRMRERRAKKKLSQQALAELMGCSISYVSMLERGQRTPPLSTVGDVAKALNCEPVVLVA